MKYLSILAACIISTFSLHAQVEEESRVMSKGSQPALTLFVSGTEPKFLETEWKDYTKNIGKAVKVKSSKEFLIEGAQILDVGGVNKINVYATGENFNAGAKVIIWMEMGSGFINKTDFKKEWDAAAKWVADFGHKVEVDQSTIDLKNQQVLLDKLNSNLAKLQTENESLTEKLALNKEAQAAAQAEIDAQAAMVAAVQKKLDETKAKKSH
jgi:hypothetical protein